MMDKCYDEGTIQAFLDGELETDTLEAVARHTAACETCALVLQEAEEESSFAFSALGEEFNSLVPTERIRTSLYKEISQIEKTQKSVWMRIFGTGFNFSNPSIIAFASLLMIVGLFTTLYIHRESQNVNTNQVARIPVKKSTESVRQNVPDVVAPASAAGESVESGENEAGTATVSQPVYKRPVENQPRFERAGYRVVKTSSRRVDSDSSADTSKNTLNEILPGEDAYVKTIATLSDSVNNRKDILLRPSERVAFERDLAVVNDAISKMRKEVRKNPKNEAAKQVLRSSYQNKIDLLNSVAEKSELMATLR